MTDILKALAKYRTDLLRDFYSEIFNEIQGLGGPGLHSENMINRQEALDALKKSYDKMKNN